MYSVGDKVRIKNEIGYENTRVGNIEELKKRVLTVNSIGEIQDDGSRTIHVCEDNKWSFNSKWFELVEDRESTKFEAFLREVANQKSLSYGQEWNWLNNIVHNRDHDITNDKTMDSTVAKLVGFYKTFEPKPPKKRLTMAELRGIIGEDFEIVEE